MQLTSEERALIYEQALHAYAEHVSAGDTLEGRLLLAEYQLLMRMYVSLSVAD